LIAGGRFSAESFNNLALAPVSTTAVKSLFRNAFVISGG
jgi:hypothetical protein